MYVNDYTRALDERAVQVLLDWSQHQQIARGWASTLPVFA